MASQKTKVIEHLFFKHWNQATRQLRKTVMSLTDVSEAIQYCNEEYGSTLSSNNPANFMKDLMRGANASKNWPVSVATERFTAVQRTGAGDVFEFVPFRDNQTEPFPDEFKPRENAPRYPVQSISLPLVTKSLGRSDESWLIQTAINLRVVETHFAVESKLPILEVSHLQMSVKLRQTEIDALFLAKMGTEDNHSSVIVTCEAKHYNDPLIPQQIINQVQAAFDETDVDTVIPIGLRAISSKGFYLIEFKATARRYAQELVELERASDAVYELKPPVKGI